MKTVVALPGEGIGIECVEATCELLTKAGLPLRIVMPVQGEAALESHGVALPEETKKAAREADGVLFGAAGPSSTAVVAWLRWEQAAYAGVRPIKFYEGMNSPLSDPTGIDYVIIRENSEGLYPGREGDLTDLARALPELRDRTGHAVKDYGEGSFAVKIVSRNGAERIARFACQVARKRKARGKLGKVTCVTKSNVLRQSDGLFQEIVAKVVGEHGDLQFEHFHVDDAARRLVRFPKSMDVVVSMNLYSDILSDLAAETAGGLGLAPSGCFGDRWAYFESVHGSAPDIAGKGIANPTATVLSAALMLDHMGLTGEAQRLEGAVARVYRDGKVLTPDQGGAARTAEMAAAILAAYRNA